MLNHTGENWLDCPSTEASSFSFLRPSGALQAQLWT